MTMCINKLSALVFLLDMMVLCVMNNVRMIFCYFVFWVVTWKWRSVKRITHPSTSDAVSTTPCT
jgi:hypothetical protein